MILSVFFCLMSVPLLAQERTFDPEAGSLFKWAIIISGAVIAVAASAGAFCQAKAIKSACEGISRNPASAPHIRFLVLLGLVLIETLVIYALFIAIFIIMIQWGNYFLK